ncbi:MAG: carboxypeptidase regulatory-like domain-containing protein [Planctomycetes bacterium]|nr:carboxypeptidase regulatory-like domain-containing protein [Planctomycetota bacterium]
MNEQDRIFEENLQKLFKRAYQPAPCREEFRDALLARILKRVDLYHHRRHHRILSLPLGLAVAASLFVGFGFLGWLLGWFGSNEAQTESRGNSVVAAPGEGVRRSIDGIYDKTASRRRADSLQNTHAGDVAGPASHSEDAPNTGSLQCICLDSESNEKIAFARVVLIRQTGDFTKVESFTSDLRAGSLDLGGVPVGKYDIYAIADGYAPLHATGVVVDARETTNRVSLAMNRGGRLLGRVIEAETGRPVDGALVLSEPDTPEMFLPSSFKEALDPGRSAARTDPDGYFDILHASAGTQQLRASREGLAPAWTPEFPLSLRGEKADLLLQMKSGGGVRGAVRNVAGDPAGVTEVMAIFADTQMKRSRLTLESAKTDAIGEYQIPHLAEGLYSVVVKFEGGRVDVKPCSIHNGQWTDLSFGGAVAKHALRGTVRTASGKVPEGFSMSVVPIKPGVKSSTSWKIATIEDNLTYQFIDLDPGDYSVLLAGPFGMRLITLGTVRVPETADAEFNAVLGAGRIDGDVRDANTGEGAGRARIFLMELDASGRAAQFAGMTFTDTAGKFNLNYLGMKQYRVSAYAAEGDYGVEMQDPPALRADHPHEIVHLKLGPGATVRVAARNEARAPIANATIQFFNDAGVEVGFGEPPTVTNEMGVFAASCVKPGFWTVKATFAQIAASARVEIVAGENPDVELILKQ